MGAARMVVCAWVCRTSLGRHAIGVKRVSGDTFQFHIFYRRLREAMAPITGWNGGGGVCGGSYARHVTFGVCANGSTSDDPVTSDEETCSGRA
eukprot:6486953-Prymnesium_polylepis.1